MAVRLEGSLVAVVFAASLLAGPAQADAAGDAAVAAMDAVINRATTLVIDYQISNQEAGKSERALAMKARMMGPKRLYEFTAPADMNGIKFLILSPTQMYVYLPSFGKVRRIASHTKSLGFFGLAFSQDDLAVTSYGAQYVGQVASQTPTQYVLVSHCQGTGPELRQDRDHAGQGPDASTATQVLQLRRSEHQDRDAVELRVYGSRVRTG
jgi:hypothetical protein